MTAGYGGIGSVAATTNNATNIGSSSATLNGTVFPQQYGSSPATVYFEYSTSQNCFQQYTYVSASSCAQQTTPQIATNYSSNYTSYVNVSPNTTYYYRIVSISAGQFTFGSVLSFTTLGNQTIIAPTSPAAPVAPIIITRYINSPAIVSNNNAPAITLSMTATPQSVISGNPINYLVTYQNTSNKAVSNAILNVMLPFGVTFQQSSQGMATTNNTVVANIGTISPNQQGTVTVSAVAGSSINSNSNLSANATLAFTNSNNTQDSVVANTFTMMAGSQNYNANQSNLGGFALAGSGFFPTTLTEWLIIAAIILGLIFLSRELTRPRGAPRNPVYPPNNYDNH